jgi:hypothetical protein
MSKKRPREKPKTIKSKYFGVENFKRVKYLLENTAIKISDYEKPHSIFSVMAAYKKNLIMIPNTGDYCRELLISSLIGLQSANTSKSDSEDREDIPPLKESGLLYDRDYDNEFGILDFPYKKYFNKDYFLLFVVPKGKKHIEHFPIAIYKLNEIEKKAGVKRTCAYEMNDGYVVLFSSDWTYSTVLLSAFLMYLKEAVEIYKFEKPEVKDLDNDVAILLKNREVIFGKRKAKRFGGNSTSSYGISMFYVYSKYAPDYWGSYYECEAYRRFLNIKNWQYA